jgi:DNA-binding NtrC family response regulator
MGEMDGVAFLTQVSRIYPETMRIMLSGQAQKGARIEAVNRGAVAKHFEKPVSLTTLRGAVRDAVSRFEARKIA